MNYNDQKQSGQQDKNILSIKKINFRSQKYLPYDLYSKNSKNIVKKMKKNIPCLTLEKF